MDTDAHLEVLESRTLLAVYYVATSGNNSNNGSQNAPWATLQFAADRVVAGDQVNVLPGNFVGFDLRTDGTGALPITFRSTGGGVAITSPNTRTNQDGINLEGANWIVIEGFTVNSMPRAGIRSVLNHHVSIRNNSCDSNGRWGIFTGFSDDLLIENNITTRSQIEHGIYVSNSGDRPVIRNNLIHSNRSNGIHMNGDVSQGGDGVITGALVERNTIYNNGLGGGSGINCDGVQDSRFVNNLLYDNHASGISLYRIDGGEPSTGNVVVNNTIVQASNGRWCINIRDGSTGNTLYNNILWNNHPSRGSISAWADSLAGLVSDHNAVMSRFTTNDGASVMTLAQWRAATGQEPHSFIATPAQLFVSAAGNDYHLSAASPAIDTGTATQAPPIDLEGNARPAGAGFDVGAYERTVDVTPPIVLASDFNFLTSQEIVIRFSENVSTSLTAGDLVLENLTSGQTVPPGAMALSYDVLTNTALFTFPGYGGILPNGNYRATLPAGSVTDAAGNPLPSSHVLNFFFLQGDANHDGTVNLTDFNVLTANYGAQDADFSQGDFNYDGIVNLADFNVLAGAYGDSL